MSIFRSRVYKIAFKPLVASADPIPETFEGLICTGPDDLEIQKTPSVWFTRTSGAIHFNKKTKVLEVGKKFIGPMLFRGSCEVTVPKGYFSNKQGIEVEFRGFGHFSLKIMESTVTEGGVRLYAEEGWQKLDTTREAEIFTWSRRWQKKILYFEHFYNKPLNVGLKPYLKGFKPINLSRVASLEIAGRVGMIEVKSLKVI